MDYNIANIQIIAEQLRYAKDEGYSTAILMGAGMSISAGIPSAKGMIDKIKNQFPHLCNTCENKTYPAYMSLLAPAQRRKFIGSFIDKAKINLAHLYLGSIVKKGYVDRILTTNFDPLVARSLSLFNVYPAVYDFAASQSFIPGEAAQLSVFHLHGQRDGFVLMNTEEEITKHSAKLKNVFQDFNRRRCWIVIGYSGENDPVFERLAEIDVFQHKLFWIGYNDKEPAKHILEKILIPKDKFGYYVKGYDADRFFLNLARELNLTEPQIISRPFSHLKEAIDIIAEYPIDDKLADPTKETKKWINLAIKGFEEGKGFENIESATKKEIKVDETIRKARDIWVHGRFNQINSFFNDIKTSELLEAKEYLSNALNNWGNYYFTLAKKKEGEEAEALFRLTFAKYEKALELKPNNSLVYKNWGIALQDFAEKKEGEEAEALLWLSFEKYGKAMELKPDDQTVLYNWGNALHDLAKRNRGERAEALLWLSFEKYEKAIELEPKDQTVYNNWGSALHDLAKKKKDKKAEALLRQSIEKYKKALELKPDYQIALNNWGIALKDLAKEKKGKEAEALLRQSFEKYEKALELKPDDQNALKNWEIALQELDKKKQGKEGEALLRQYFEKYKKLKNIQKDLIVNE